MNLEELMTPNPVVVPATATAHEASVIMRDHNIGNVLVEHEGHLTGIITDRDLVVRVVAEGLDPTQALLGDVCSGDLTTLALDCDVEEAAKVMAANSVRRVPVVRHGQAVGIVSLGDIVIELDRRSVLADISSAQPNN